MLKRSDRYIIYQRNINIICYYIYIVMDIETLIKENNLLREENEKLQKQLKNFNNSRKTYYENNKEIVKERAKERLKKLAEENPDKIKEYAKKAYQKQKEKKKQKELENI
jgi:cell division septum initiation protein DivIVA